MQRIMNMNPYTAGRARSLSREILSSTQVKLLELKGAQAKYIGKIACVVGSEIDREVSIKHSEMLASSFKKKGLDQKTNHQDLMKSEIEEIFV